MNARRDFLVLTLGAAAATALLPAPTATAASARAELEAMAECDPATAKLLEIWDGASPRGRTCITVMVARVCYGMDMVEAGDLFHLDLADPSRAMTF